MPIFLGLGGTCPLGPWAYGNSLVKGGRGVDLPEILHTICFLLASKNSRSVPAIGLAEVGVLYLSLTTLLPSAIFLVKSEISAYKS